MHFAQFLYNRGLVSNLNEVFVRYLGIRALAYVSKNYFSSEEGISVIIEAGGMLILAHPGILSISKLHLERLIKKLIEFGLQGIEVFYSEHSCLVQRKLLLLARVIGY